MTDITVIWNPHSGRAASCEDLRDKLDALPLVSLVESESARHAEQLAAAAARSSKIVAAAGGDGTIHSVVQGLQYAAKQTSNDTAVLGIIPLGSGNDLCRNLDLPLDPHAAAELLLSLSLLLTTGAVPSAGRLVEMDLIDVSFDGADACYANMATGGNSGEGLHRLDDEAKQRWGPLCYLRGALEIVSELQVFRADITIHDEQWHQCPVLNMFIANGSGTGGGFNVAPHAVPDDGLLDVILIRDSEPIELATMAAQLLLGDYTHCEHVIWRQASEVSLKVSPGMRWTTDGEHVNPSGDGTYSTVQFRVRPAAQRVLAGDPARLT